MADQTLLTEVQANPRWYHTMELAPGIVTSGYFDLRPIVGHLPWPDLNGKRCLDIGTFDGFLAFEMERRGAAEVIATDIAHIPSMDWPLDVQRLSPEHIAERASQPRGRGFEIAAAALGSSVQRVEMNIYDLNPDQVGSFDVVVCGSLLLHLRDPLRALEAVRSVCSGVLLSSEEIDVRLSLMHPRTPLTKLNGMGKLMQWHVPNRCGHRQMILASGFTVERTIPMFSIPFGPGGPHGRRRLASLTDALPQTLASRGRGVPHSAILGRVLV